MHTFQIFGFDLTVWKLIIVMGCAFGAGFTKTGIIGLGVIITPALASVVPAGVSLGFMLPLYILGDITAISKLWRMARWRPLIKALPWGFIGVFVAWRLAAWVLNKFGPESDAILRNIIGGLMAIVVALGWYVSRHPELATGRKQPAPEAVPAVGASAAADPEVRAGDNVRTWYAVTLGTFAGFVSMLTNSGGPIWALYLSSLGLGVSEVLGTAAWCFFLVTLAKLPIGASLGFLDANTLWFNLCLAPLTIFGAMIGKYFSGKFSREAFAGMIRVLAMLGAIYLLVF